MGDSATMTALEEAKRLVSIPSVTGDEAAIAAYLECRLKELGCTTRTFEAGKNRFNVYARFGGNPDLKPGILFHGHIDTVPPYAMENPFNPELRDGQLYGRGSVDQKGGLAAVLAAFERFLASGKLLKKPCSLVCVIDEESEHRGSMALASMGIEAEFGVVTEPTGLRLGIGCKGTAPILVHIDGKAAHGCRPWLGKNAVLAGMDIARLIMEMPMPEVEIPGIGTARGSVNLGKMEGGKAYNIVADSCDIWFDRRTVPGETQWKVLKEFQAVIASRTAEPDIKISVNIARPDWNWEPIQNRGLLPATTDMSDPRFDSIQAAHRSILGKDPVLFFTDGYQEMDFLVNDLGINAIQYGPGDSSLCHTVNEHLDIAQLESCTDVYEAMILGLCG